MCGSIGGHDEEVGARLETVSNRKGFAVVLTGCAAVGLMAVLNWLGTSVDPRYSEAWSTTRLVLIVGIVPTFIGICMLYVQSPPLLRVIVVATATLYCLSIPFLLLAFVTVV